MVIGYSPYQLFRTLIERVAWPSEAEKVAALTSVDEFERMGMFGNLAKLTECKHPEESVETRGYPPVSICRGCGRQVGTPERDISRHTRGYW